MYDDDMDQGIKLPTSLAYWKEFHRQVYSSESPEEYARKALLWDRHNNKQDEAIGKIVNWIGMEMFQTTTGGHKIKAHGVNPNSFGGQSGGADFVNSMAPHARNFLHYITTISSGSTLLTKRQQYDEILRLLRLDHTEVNPVLPYLSPEQFDEANANPRLGYPASLIARWRAVLKRFCSMSELYTANLNARDPLLPPKTITPLHNEAFVYREKYLLQDFITWRVFEVLHRLFRVYVDTIGEFDFACMDFQYNEVEQEEHTAAASFLAYRYGGQQGGSCILELKTQPDAQVWIDPKRWGKTLQKQSQTAELRNVLPGGATKRSISLKEALVGEEPRFQGASDDDTFRAVLQQNVQPGTDHDNLWRTQAGGAPAMKPLVSKTPDPPPRGDDCPKLVGPHVTACAFVDQWLEKGRQCLVFGSGGVSIPTSMVVGALHTKRLADVGGDARKLWTPRTDAAACRDLAGRVRDACIFDRYKVEFAKDGIKNDNDVTAETTGRYFTPEEEWGKQGLVCVQFQEANTEQSIRNAAMQQTDAEWGNGGDTKIDYNMARTRGTMNGVWRDIPYDKIENRRLDNGRHIHGVPTWYRMDKSPVDGKLVYDFTRPLTIGCHSQDEYEKYVTTSLMLSSSLHHLTDVTACLKRETQLTCVDDLLRTLDQIIPGTSSMSMYELAKNVTMKDLFDCIAHQPKFVKAASYLQKRSDMSLLHFFSTKPTADDSFLIHAQVERLLLGACEPDNDDEIADSTTLLDVERIKGILRDATFFTRIARTMGTCSRLAHAHGRPHQNSVNDRATYMLAPFAGKNTADAYYTAGTATSNKDKLEDFVNNTDPNRNGGLGIIPAVQAVFNVTWPRGMVMNALKRQGALEGTGIDDTCTYTSASPAAGVDPKILRFHNALREMAVLCNPIRMIYYGASSPEQTPGEQKADFDSYQLIVKATMLYKLLFCSLRSWHLSGRTAPLMSFPGMSLLQKAANVQAPPSFTPPPTWPIRTILPGNGATAFGYAACLADDATPTPVDALPSNVITQDGWATPSADDTTGLASGDACGGTLRHHGSAMKLLKMRLAVQHYYGMFVAAAVFHNIFGSDDEKYLFPEVRQPFGTKDEAETAKDHWNKTWRKLVDSEDDAFSVDKENEKRLVFESADDPNVAVHRLMEKAHEIAGQRLRILHEGSTADRRRLLARLVDRIAPYAPAGEDTFPGLVDSAKYDGVPTELLGTSANPLLFFAGSCDSYKTQWKGARDLSTTLREDILHSTNWTTGRLLYFDQTLATNIDPDFGHYNVKWVRARLEPFGQDVPLGRDVVAEELPYEGVDDQLPKRPAKLSLKGVLKAFDGMMEKVRPIAAALAGDAFRGTEDAYRAVSGDPLAMYPPMASQFNTIMPTLPRGKLWQQAVNQAVRQDFQEHLPPTTEACGPHDKYWPYRTEMAVGTHNVVHYPVSSGRRVRKVNNPDQSSELVRGCVKLHDTMDNEGTKRLLVSRLSGADYKRAIDGAGELRYNYNLERPQFFAALDAAGLLWHARRFVNPADANRPEADKENPQPGDVHPWVECLLQTMVYSRQLYRSEYERELWEVDVKKAPSRALPTSHIGALTDDEWKRAFPLLPSKHPLRETIRRMRAMEVMWGTLPAYDSGTHGAHSGGAWMPLSVAHQVRLLNHVGLFDDKYRVPRNPWNAHEGQWLGSIFNQSYHSVYYTDCYRAKHFRQWLKHACAYQFKTDKCHYPFSQCGGTPVLADFERHRCEAPEEGEEWRHSMLMRNRFGLTGALRVGRLFNDTGLLQDFLSYEYRAHARLDPDQREVSKATTIWPSNFLAYARTHAIMALASCNPGTQSISEPRVVRNLYRTFVDTYECAGSDDGVPVVMGFLPSAVSSTSDRPITFYAGSVPCINSKLATFCSSSANLNERVCQLYKQAYLNDATLLFTRLLRVERRKKLHDNNFLKAQSRRVRGFNRAKFDGEVIDLQDAYIEFLQTSLLGTLVEMGADLRNVPLHLLEPRELEVPLFAEDTDVVGNDFLAPETRELVGQLDFVGDTMSRTQMAILSLIPPNSRVFGTMRMNQKTEIYYMEHIKKQVQKETIASNKLVWQHYLTKLLQAAFGAKFLEVAGPVDHGLDPEDLKKPVPNFDPQQIRNPLKESEGLGGKMATTQGQVMGPVAQQLRAQQLRAPTGEGSVVAMNSKMSQQALQSIRRHVEQQYSAHGGAKTRERIVSELRLQPHMDRIVRHALGLSQRGA